MLNRGIIAIAASFVLATPAAAAFACNGALTDSQVEGFATLFNPDFSPSLSHTGGAVAPANMSKVVSQAIFDGLKVSAPLIAASATLNANDAGTLKGWLNANAEESIPGWFSTALGIVVPAAWVGLTADIASQLINGSGDAGRIKLANIAGTVSEGGVVGVVHRIADGTGGPQYLWNYVYTAKLNDKIVTYMLYSCSANAVVQ